MANHSSSYNITTPDFVPLISDEAADIIRFALFIVTGSSISFFGVIANAVNIAVYLKMGVKDSATFQFFALAVTDLLYSALVLTTSISLLVNEVNPDLTVLDPFSFALNGINQTREKVYATSIVITLFLSVERCFCVLFPFKVKTLFTKSRSVKANACVVFVFGALLVPDYMTERLGWKHDPRFNTTRLLTWISDRRIGFVIFKDAIFAALLPVSAGITTTVCAGIMVGKIRRSTKFRQMNMSAKSSEQRSECISRSGKGKNNASSAPLTTKETRLCRTMIAIDAIFIACNVPKFMILANSVVEKFIPEFRLDVVGRYQNFVSMTVAFAYTFEATNAAVSFLVYFFSTIKFRSSCGQVFCNAKATRTTGNIPRGSS